MDEAMAKRFFLAQNSVFSCLVAELSKAKLINVGALVENIQGTAADHQLRGDPDQIAPIMHAISEHLLKTVPDPKIEPPKGG